ncbi:MAG: IS3 family transposase, partial [Armatimonadetes bacterium]|nr:IS3 family transposase [Armatimonadota bacterium]
MVDNLSDRVGTKTSCDVFGLPRSSYYYRQNPVAKNVSCSNRKLPDFAYSSQEKQEILNVLNSDIYMNQTPYEIYASRLDKGEYLSSVRTMYRILNDNYQVKERRNVRRSNNYQKPELLATKVNQIWSWDITKLKGPEKWTYFYLYVIIDIFSRFVVGWMVAYR